MPVKRGGTIDPEATRAKVLAAADLLFYERGVHRVGVDEISERAGASKLSLYRYFRSKEGLLEAVTRERSARIHEWLLRSTRDAPPGRDRVLALFDVLVGWYGENDYRGCAVLNTAAETRGRVPAVRELAREHLGRYRDMLSDWLAEAGAAGPEALAGQLLVLIEGATMITSIEGRDTAGRDARRAAEALVDAALPPDAASR